MEYVNGTAVDNEKALISRTLTRNQGFNIYLDVYSGLALPVSGQDDRINLQKSLLARLFHRIPVRMEQLRDGDPEPLETMAYFFVSLGNSFLLA
ncbi:hypothetical protein P4H39_32125 [Paenibacillus lautus]|uniref:hypothetical protein n=1 Tax=Paenibacillus lautus TaxID=1401 RepID=UPI002DBE5A6A|nr:hypothetical protein [Paenibacillus lautus]MEC0207260.1 hypothetical protein [Paenibacillus lautus]